MRRSVSSTESAGFSSAATANSRHDSSDSPSKDITIHDTTVTISVGRDRVALAEPVAVFVAAFIETRRGRAATDTTAASRWLFPRGFAGRHLDPETLANRLRQLGISAIELHTDVLLDLAADIPPAILADLSGLYPQPQPVGRTPPAATGPTSSQRETTLG